MLYIVWHACGVVDVHQYVYTMSCVEMRGGKDPIWGIPAVQVLVTLLDEPRLEGALRQCRPLVASSQYTAEVSKVYTLSLPVRPCWEMVYSCFKAFAVSNGTISIPSCVVSGFTVGKVCIRCIFVEFNNNCLWCILCSMYS